METIDRGRCPKCGATEIVGKPYTHVQRVGRYTTKDGCGVAPTCAKCGEVAMNLDDLAVFQMAAAKTVLYEGKTDADVLRFARKALGYTQAELSSVLGYTVETISALENGKRQAEPVYTLALAGILSSIVDRHTTPEEVLQQADVSGRPSQGELRVRRVG